jgi:hypothetical protein
MPSRLAFWTVIVTGFFGAPELAPDHARLEPQHEIRVAAGKSRNDAEYGAVFTDIGHGGFLPENERKPSSGMIILKVFYEASQGTLDPRLSASELRVSLNWY